MKDFIKKNILLIKIFFGLFIIWIFIFHIPRQKCISQISLDGSTYLYEPDDAFKEDKSFKTRNDALDYCIAKNSLFF